MAKRKDLDFKVPALPTTTFCFFSQIRASILTWIIRPLVRGYSSNGRSSAKKQVERHRHHLYLRLMDTSAETAFLSQAHNLWMSHSLPALPMFLAGRRVKYDKDEGLKGGEEEKSTSND